MNFAKPVVVYTARTNVEAHLIVELLDRNGVPAHVVEDQSGASLWAFGTISQYHKPNIWVDEPTRERAAELIAEFEERRRQQDEVERHGEGGDLEVECEECGKSTRFSNKLSGTIQECPHCRAYIDVGDEDWDEDFGEAEE